VGPGIWHNSICISREEDLSMRKSPTLLLCIVLTSLFLSGIPITHVFAGPYHHPAEFDPIEEILLGCEDSYLVLDIYRGTLRALENEPVTINILVNSRYVAHQLYYEFYYSGLSLQNVNIYLCPIDSVWMRDYGPLIVKDSQGRRYAGDPHYYYYRPNDDAIPRIWAQFRGFGVNWVNLDYEGGNFMTDGQGNAFATKYLYWYNTHYTPAQIDSIMDYYLGCDRVYTLTPMHNEGTGHIDMFAKLVRYDTVLVASYPAGNVNYDVLNANANQFRSLGYNVVRIPMAGSEFNSYTNALLVNGVALVPTYNSQTDSTALQIFRNLGYRAVGIDCSLAIQYGGAVHCVSMQIPR
jgi:agmatine/peptidylarginine deiminase